jgi:hypothetical protein
MPTLHEIEKAMSTLWMNRHARAWLFSDESIDEAPEEVAAIDPQILKEMDRKGASLYAGSINYEHHHMADVIFPYCAKIIGKDWDELVKDYYQAYPSSHYNFNKICINFSRYLSEQRPELLSKYPYLAELADYEWLELEKSEDEREVKNAERIEINSLEQITQYCPMVNPTLTMRHYEYPIPDIAEKLENSKRVQKKFKAEACNVAIYRDSETFNTRFMQLGTASSTIIETAQSKPSSYQELLKIGISLSSYSDPEKIVSEFLELIEELHTDNIFVGSKKI